MVRRTLIQKSTPQPEMRKTPSGGTDALSVGLCKGAPHIQAAGNWGFACPSHVGEGVVRMSR